MSAKICILISRPSFSAQAEGKLVHGYDMHFLEEKCKRAGILMSDVEIVSLERPDLAGYDALSYLNERDFNVIVALDEKPLNFLTGKKSIWKWHLSPLDSLEGVKCRKVVPTFHFDQMKKEYFLGLYFEMALRRAQQFSAPGPWVRKQKNYLLDPNHDESIAVLENIMLKPWHSIDIETGRNQINTFGVAWSPNDAIAVKMIPGEMPAAVHHKLWSLIHKLCESDSKKVMQNGIYERMYLSRYGIHINNFKHDTMCAMKFLWPELEKGLDNVGRVYTMEPYWKDDGRVASEEGKQKDWGNIRDWPLHLNYNCNDTANTYEAMIGQQANLRARGLQAVYDKLVARNFDPTYEMSAEGFPMNPDRQKLLIAEYEKKSTELVSQLSKQINPRSPKQKLNLLRDKGYKLSVKRSTGKESADELSLKRLRLQHPDDNDLKILLEVAGIEKALSSYLRVRTFPDNRIRFMLDPHGTETGRMSCSKDPWDRGFNAQTMTDYAKNMIEWTPEANRVFVEIDLSQAESRFVAYDACEVNLLGMLERKEDIHRYVAAEIYQKPMAEVTHDERQLGKKSGHGANYNMGANTFMDSCLKEMDLVLNKQMATRVLESYHKLFPGIRRWHGAIRNTVYCERKLTNPLGRVRYFYGRTDDNTYREAFAYRPQSTVPDIVNHLMHGLCGQRTEGAVTFRLHCQTHDSITLSCAPEQVPLIGKYAKETALWHPEIILPAGRLVIPTDVKAGTCLGNLTKLTQ